MLTFINKYDKNERNSAFISRDRGHYTIAKLHKIYLEKTKGDDNL